MGYQGRLMGYGFSVRTALALAAAWLVGCSSGPPSTDQAEEKLGTSSQAINGPATVNQDLSAVIPLGTSIADVMISSTDRVTIDDRSTLAIPTKLSKVANLGKNTLELGAGVKAYTDVFSVGSVNFLRSGSQIAGNLTTAGTVLQQNNVTIGGLVKSGAKIEPNETKWTVAWPSGVTNDINRSPDAANLDIAPGAYNSVHAYSRSTITLRSGTYFINSLVLEPQVHFRVDTSSGPVLIYVHDTLSLRVGLEYLKGPRGQVLFGYVGQQTALFEEALVATVVAPSSAIELRRPNSGLPHEGSFFGKEVHVFSDAVVRHLPFDWSFLCPQGDHDGDGVSACNETCDNDPKKTEPQFCGCGEAETDSDGDGVPDCQDECKHDPNNQYRGQCGCANEPGVAPAGKPCNDGVVNGNFTCNGAGTCGNPAAGAPQAGCKWKTLGTHVYWFCPAATPADAAKRCNSSPGGRLVELDTYLENYFVAHSIAASSLTGATDRTTEGEWTWRYTATLDAKKFWTGGSAGHAYHGLFSRFPGGDPKNDDALDCGLIDTKGNWSVASCATAVPYVCERPFGPSWNPGNGLHHDPKGPGNLYPDWASHNGGGDGSSIPLDKCTPYTPGPRAIHPEYGGLSLNADTVELYNCDRDCPEGSSKSEAECRALCTGAATPPPAGTTERCSDTGDPSRQLAWLLPGTCSVVNRDCTAASQSAGQALTCGQRTQCFEIHKQSSGAWKAQKCTDGCAAGSTCDAPSGLCVDPSQHNVCDASDGKACVGQCFNQVGCGVYETISDGGYTEVDRPCQEVRVCPDAGDYAGPMNGPDLSNPEQINLARLPDQSTVPPPAYSNDFQTACGSGTCSGCAAEGGPSCDRSARHPWCNMDAALPPTSTGDQGVSDTRKGGRGNDSSLIKFDLDPDADLDFKVEPLPFGLARFNLDAAAAIRAKASFAFAGISGDIELVDLRGQLTASLCRVSTADSRLEILGNDFLPSLAGKLRFDTSADQPSLTKSCEDAVATYVDTVDRAKKAMRDAQELIKQYRDLKQAGHTFGPAFCKAVADAGLRPKGMPGADLADPCAHESPEQTVNAFIGYYKQQVGLIDGARQALADTVLDSHKLASLLGLGSLAPAADGFDFYADFGDLVKGEETTTLLNVNFFIGPVPCNLEVSSYINYGIQGGLGVNLWPQALIDGAGDFAKAGAIIMPYADSGVTLFVGVGFDAGPLSVKVGLSGSITLVNVQLPATASAGLAINPERVSTTDRPLPADLADLSNGTVLYPGKGLSRYNFQYVYSYGVDLTLSDILNGHLDGSIIVKFFWFKKRWSKQLVSFTGLPPIGPFNLIGGGSPKPDEWPNEPVAEDTRSWTSGYDSVPFVAIADVKPPTSTDPPLVADGALKTDRVAQLFYDSLCTCDVRGAACDRKADCCDATDSCFHDPALGAGKKVCSQCRAFADPTYAAPNGVHESCNTDTDCCGGGVCQTNVQLRKNCVLNCSIPSYLSAHQNECRCPDPAYASAHKVDCDAYNSMLHLNTPDTDFTCETYTVPYGVCVTKPVDGGPVL